MSKPFVTCAFCSTLHSKNALMRYGTASPQKNGRLAWLGKGGNTSDYVSVMVQGLSDPPGSLGADVCKERGAKGYTGTSPPGKPDMKSG